MSNWRSLLVFAEVVIGPYKFDCGIEKKLDDDHETVRGYCVSINRQESAESAIAATNDNDAVKLGLARIGEILHERLSQFEGNAYAYPLVEVDEEVEEES